MKLFKALTILLLVAILSACTNQPADLPALPEASETAIVLPEPTEPAADLATPTDTLPVETENPTPPPTPVQSEEVSSPPAVILFIGDGMGQVHRQAATWLAFGIEGSLVMDSLPVQGMAQTASADHAVTDSAAAASAMATGQLTNNLMLSVDPQGNPLETILEIAKARGMATGLVSTVQLAHATPAAFAVHHADREEMPEIADLIIDQGVDVLLGGGEDDFLPWTETGCFPAIGHQQIETDLINEAVGKGYTYICSPDQLASLNTNITSKLLGLFADDEIKPPYQPNLVQMTETALEILSQDPDGFFLMVEAGQIDWAAHKNVTEETIHNTIGLDSALTLAVIYALEHPNTLLIVAADHETGGMSVNLERDGSLIQDGPFHMPDGTEFWVDWSSGSHTGANVPISAQGPYSEMLQGEYPLTRIFEAMLAMIEAN